MSNEQAARELVKVAKSLVGQPNIRRKIIELISKANSAVGYIKAAGEEFEDLVNTRNLDPDAKKKVEALKSEFEKQGNSYRTFVTKLIKEIKDIGR